MADFIGIVNKYTSGETDLEETNAALKKAGAFFRLDPEWNTLTVKEMSVTWGGDTPEEANGWGLMDTGTGTLYKVHIVDGKLNYVVNQVQEDGSTNMAAYVYIGGKRYEVFGDRLENISHRKAAKRANSPKSRICGGGPTWPDRKPHRGPLPGIIASPMMISDMQSVPSG